jgi:hypothetical protein
MSLFTFSGRDSFAVIELRNVLFRNFRTHTGKKIFEHLPSHSNDTEQQQMTVCTGQEEEDLNHGRTVYRPSSGGSGFRGPTTSVE